MRPASPWVKKPPESLSPLLVHFGASSLHEIKFFHAVNQKERLEKFLQSDMHIAEGDIVPGPNNIPLMHHPYRRAPIDLTFPEWIDAILADTTKGAQLDLKRPQAVEGVLNHLKKTLPAEEALRIYMSADVLRGPSGHPPKMTPDILFRIRKDFPGVLLGISFTSEHRPHQKLGYTEQMIEEILAIADALKPPLTINLRAEHFLDSDQKIRIRLLERPEIALNIFGSMYPFRGKKDWSRIFSEHYGERTFIDLVDRNLEPLRAG